MIQGPLGGRGWRPLCWPLLSLLEPVGPCKDGALGEGFVGSLAADLVLWEACCLLCVGSELRYRRQQMAAATPPEAKSEARGRTTATERQPRQRS